MLRRLLLALLLAATVTMAAAAPAQAKDPDEGTTGKPGVAQVCGTGDGAFDTYYLPVQRWSGATQNLHVRSNGGVLDFAPLQRQVQGNAFIVGDLNYLMTSTFVTWATQFCPMDRVGGSVDQAVGTFGTAMLNSPLMTTLLILTIIGAFAGSAFGVRGQEPGQIVKILGTKALILALFAAMTAGAMGSTGGGAKGSDDPYKPGTMSPGWIATTIDRIISELATGPAAALSDETIGGNEVTGDQLDCQSWTAAMQKGYKGLAATEGQVLQSRSVPAMTVSNLWQISSYQAWSVTQFGNKNTNGSSRVACRMLDNFAGIPATGGSFKMSGIALPKSRSSASIPGIFSWMDGATGMTVPEATKLVKPLAPAWRPLNNVEQDKAWVAWATCVPRDGKFTNIDKETGWSAPPGNGWLIKDDGARKDAEKVDGSKKLNEACFKLFNRDSETVDGIFDWGEGDKEINKKVGEMPASVADFLTSLHGTNQSAAGAASLAYAIGSFFVLAVFGGLALAVVIVKILCVVMIFTVLIVMLGTLLPGASGERLAKYGKQYVGLSLYAAFSLFVMALVTLFVKIIWTVIENLTGGPNSIVTMLIGGFLPAVAAVALHFSFKLAGVPSPLSVKGAVGWGQALAGGAAMGGVIEGGGKLKALAVGAGGALAGRLGGDKLGALGKRAPAGKRNADLNTDQRMKPLDPTATGKKKKKKGDPKDVLTNPNATALQKRDALRQLDAARRAEGAAAKEAAAAAKAADQDERGELGALRSAEIKGGNFRQLDKVQRKAGAETRWNWAKDRLQNAGLDTRAWLAGAKADPRGAAKRAALTGAKVAAVGGVAVTAAAFGGAPLAAVGAAVAIRNRKKLGGGSAAAYKEVRRRYLESRTRELHALRERHWERVEDERYEAAKAEGHPVVEDGGGQDRARRGIPASDIAPATPFEPRPKGRFRK